MSAGWREGKEEEWEEEFQSKFLFTWKSGEKVDESNNYENVPHKTETSNRMRPLSFQPPLRVVYLSR